MMQPIFVFAYPRSRTAWLSVFLTGAGVFCFHEAWKLVTTATDLRTLMESKGPGPVVNSDCSNIFFAEDLRREFPEARYLRILNTPTEVLASLATSYGPRDYTGVMEACRYAFEECSADLTVDCATWDIATSYAIWQFVSGDRPLDPHWLRQVEGMRVELMPWQIAHDQGAAQAGHFSHIEQRMRGAAWAS